MREQYLLIRGGRVADGSGGALFAADVLVKDDRVEAVAPGIEAPEGTRVLEAAGRVTAPGFIDLHSHADISLGKDPSSLPKIRQGVTTEVVGNCGLGVAPVGKAARDQLQRLLKSIIGDNVGASFERLPDYYDSLDAESLSVNIAPLIPHGIVRMAVMGYKNAAPDADEMKEFQRVVSEAMEAGAFGMSTGLIYPTGSFADTAELIELSKTVARYGGFYASHIRDEANGVVESVREALDIGRGAGVGVNISHHKAVGKFNFGKVNKTLGMMDAARESGLNVHCDMYPYTSGTTILSAVVLPPWVFEGSEDEFFERLRDPFTRRRMRAETEQRVMGFIPRTALTRVLPDPLLLSIVKRVLSGAIIISSVKNDHSLEGRTLRDIAGRRDPLDAAMDILLAEEGAVMVTMAAADERDLAAVLSHPETAIGTDSLDFEGNPHPRTFSAYPRLFQRYVKKDKLLTVEEAVRKSTSLPASIAGIRDRGFLRPGMAADIVVFDPDRMADISTVTQPRRRPPGIDHVVVNGTPVIEDGRFTGASPGRLLRRR